MFDLFSLLDLGFESKPLDGGDHQISGVVEMEALVSGDHCRGAVFGDDGGTGVFLAGL